MKYNILVGQVYVAADGSKCGHLVTDITTFAYCDDIVTNPFTPEGFKGNGNRIDSFKLAMVRHTLAEERPIWMPDYSLELTRIF